jgi:hypothetical protein
MDREIRARLSSRTVERLQKWYESQGKSTSIGYHGAIQSIDDAVNELLTEVEYLNELLTEV